MGIVNGEAYEHAVKLAYSGLRRHSVVLGKKGWLTTQNVCQGTCIGDREYYFQRKANQETPYGLGMFVLFGRSAEPGE